jgi:hypothetical protein
MPYDFLIQYLTDAYAAMLQGDYRPVTSIVCITIGVISMIMFVVRQFLPD